jgi:PleD family two-component response regulator
VASTAFPHVAPGDITVSLGVATYPGNGITAGELLESADIALYAAKQSGKNRVSIASTDPGARGFSSRHEDGEGESTDSF